MALITDCLRKGEFTWTKHAKEAFNLIKKKLTGLSYAILIFLKVLEVTCDASSVQVLLDVLYFSISIRSCVSSY